MSENVPTHTPASSPISPSGKLPQSRRRADQGPRLTSRDLQCLEWIAQQYAIRLDQLQRLLFRYTPEADRDKIRQGADHLSKERTYKTLARWDALGLIRYGNILDGEPRWIWVSPRVLCSLGLPLRYNQPSAVRLPHLYFVNQVRLWVESSRPLDRWMSERQLRAEQGSVARGERRDHPPDALLFAADGKTSATEVELEPESRQTLEAISYEPESSYTSILYFVSAPAQRQLEAVLTGFAPGARKHFLLYSPGDRGMADEIAPLSYLLIHITRISWAKAPQRRHLAICALLL